MAIRLTPVAVLHRLIGCCAAMRCQPPKKRFSGLLLDHDPGRGGEEITVKTWRRRTITRDLKWRSDEKPMARLATLVCPYTDTVCIYMGRDRNATSDATWYVATSDATDDVVCVARVRRGACRELTSAATSRCIRSHLVRIGVAGHVAS